jgi:hypothetical protein
MQAAVTGRRSASALLHALKSAWVVVSIGLLLKPAGSPAPPNFAESASVPELQNLMDAVQVVRRKVLANTALRSWVTWVCWVLAGMILLAATSPKLAIYTAGAGVLAAIGTVLIFVWAWRTKPSAYDAACRLDSAAGLHDRASTALFFGAIANPEGIISLQRRDALARVSQVNSGRLFPIRVPALAVRAVILAVVVAAFFVYRMHYRPPLTALLQSTARSHLMQSLLAPLEHALEQNLQRNTVQADPKQDAQEDQRRISGSEQDPDALWATADAKKDAQEMDLSEQGEDEGQQGAQGGTQSGDSDTEAEQQSQEGNNGSDSTSKDSQQSESQNSERGKSLAQSLMQALKNMMSGSSGQRMPSQGNQQRSSQGMPQSGSSDQSGKEGDRQQNSQPGRSNSDQKATQNNGNGAGNQPGSKEMKPNPVLPVRAVPDRVALQSSTMKDQMRMRNGTETGTAHLAVRPLTPKAIAVINGREQENIPARYRLYVQHYFEHVDNGPR